jgi:hypothetical protein
VTSKRFRPAPTAETGQHIASRSSGQTGRHTQQVAELDRLLLELGRSGNANLGGSGSSGAHASKDGSGRQGRTEAGGCFFATVLKKSTAKEVAGDGRNRGVWTTRERGTRDGRSGTGNKCQFMGKACLLALWLRAVGACTDSRHNGPQPSMHHFRTYL